ncbi:MAG TPA: cytochrome c oxidase assembly protein [Thermoleophilaceae bacterium]|nr:cytochrome c oxidase assembly protein [Thermoleophilaceae bacterium]
MPLAHYGGSLSVLLQLAGISLACLAFAGYWTRMQVLAEQGRPVPGVRFGCFTAGLVVLLAALSPPFDAIADDVFAMHMTQHLLIGDIAALLLVIGLTGPVLQPILHIHWVDRLRPLANPIPALSLWALNFYTWHIPFMYQAAYDNELVHAVQHVSFLFFGSLMWMPLFGPLPRPAWFGNFAKLGYIVAVRLLGTLLGNVFIWSGTVFYGFYGPGEAKHGLGALTDQSVAGAVMMIEQSILTICLFGWLFMRAAAEGEEKQELLEFAAARGVELDERRAARAVSAGRGEELRRRIEARSPERGPPPTPGAASTA